MTRSRTALTAALAAAAVIGALLWLVLGGGPAVEPAPPPAAPEPAAPPPPEEGPPVARAPVPAKPSIESAPEPRPSAGGGFLLPEEAPADPTVPGLATLEDGTPLAGVRFWFGQGPGAGKSRGNEVSGADGTFALPPDRPASVAHEWAVPVAAAGGTLEREIVRVAADADRLVLTFRDRPGTAHVRLVDSSTGKPVTDVAGLRMTWAFPGAELVVNLETDPGLGGWIPITEGRLPDNVGVDPAQLRADPAKVTVVLAMPGFEEARLPLPEVRGRREIQVAPVEADVRGAVEFPPVFISTLSSGPPVETGGRVTASLRSLDPEPQPIPADLQGLPRDVGPFRLFGVPDGAWELRVSMKGLVGKAEYTATATFEKRGAPADLGTLTLRTEGGAALAVHVVDADGRPMPQASVVVLPAGASGDGVEPLLLDGEGRVTVGGLQDGSDVRIQVRGLPRLLEKTVRVEAMKEGASTYPPVVEFAWPEKLVPCRITLVVDGKVVANPDGSRTIPATIKESPLPRDRGAWGADGTFSADLVPGTYRFSAWATAKDGNGLVLFTGEVTVPAGESFETRLEMRSP